jgi:hypothetical protein
MVEQGNLPPVYGFVTNYFRHIMQMHVTQQLTGTLAIDNLPLGVYINPNPADVLGVPDPNNPAGPHLNVNHVPAMPISNDPASPENQGEMALQEMQQKRGTLPPNKRRI